MTKTEPPIGDTCEIKIPYKDQIFIALIDAEDYPVVSRFHWQIIFIGTRKNPYAITKLNRRGNTELTFYMHHLIVGNISHMDHDDRNTLNNKKLNLRASTPQQNGWNKDKMHSDKKKYTSKYKGVSKNKKSGFWEVIIKTTKKGVKPAQHIRLGQFKYEDDAARAYNKAVVELRGEWAWVNPIDGEAA